MMSSSEIKRLTWNQLRKSYWMLFVVLIIVGIVEGATASIGIGFIIAGPLAVGLASYQLSIIFDKGNGDGNDFERILDGFKNNFVTSLVAFIVSTIFIFLWSLLFVIPGIIKAYSYSQIYYIMHENPEMSPMDAIDESKEMMRGHKAELFFLDLSFIGWILLSIITFGVGFIFLAPYMSLARANFYDQLRRRPVKNDDQSEYEINFE